MTAIVRASLFIAESRRFIHAWHSAGHKQSGCYYWFDVPPDVSPTSDELAEMARFADRQLLEKWDCGKTRH